MIEGLKFQLGGAGRMGVVRQRVTLPGRASSRAMLRVRLTHIGEPLLQGHQDFRYFFGCSMPGRMGSAGFRCGVSSGGMRGRGFRACGTSGADALECSVSCAGYLVDRSTLFMGRDVKRAVLILIEQ